MALASCLVSGRSGEMHLMNYIQRSFGFRDAFGALHSAFIQRPLSQHCLKKRKLNLSALKGMGFREHSWCDMASALIGSKKQCIGLDCYPYHLMVYLRCLIL